MASFAPFQGVSSSDIINATDWASARTMFSKYIRLLPARAISASQGNALQDVLIIT